MFVTFVKKNFHQTKGKEKEGVNLGSQTHTTLTGSLVTFACIGFTANVYMWNYVILEITIYAQIVSKTTTYRFTVH